MSNHYSTVSLVIMESNIFYIQGFLFQKINIKNIVEKRRLSQLVGVRALTLS